MAHKEALVELVNPESITYWLPTASTTYSPDQAASLAAKDLPLENPGQSRP